MSEKNLNDNPEQSGSFNGMFDENTSDYIITQNMNRDYLWSIYNDDMDSLNKEIRMTRSDYIRRRVQIEKYIDTEIKADKKRILIRVAL